MTATTVIAKAFNVGPLLSRARDQAADRAHSKDESDGHEGDGRGDQIRLHLLLLNGV